jgi:IPT/TIG domain
VVSATQITAVTPALGAGSHGFAVTTPGGTSAYVSGDVFTALAGPAITSIAPKSDPEAGGTTVTLTGTGFTGATAVIVGSKAVSSFNVVSSTQITAVTPALGAGSHGFAVTTPGGTSAYTSADLFTAVAGPAITSISPNSGPAVGGTTVTLTGTGFTRATAVAVGGKAVTSFTVVSATQITAVTPALGAGSHGFAVTTPNGTSAFVNGDLFTAIAGPSITSISPTSGPKAGGTTVTVTGTGFTGATKLTIGGVTVASFTVVSATQITFVTPALGAGGHGIAVTTPNGTSPYVGGDVFTAM